MEAFHNLLREAANSRNNPTGTSNSLPQLGMPQPAMSSSNMPMGMSLPMPMSNLSTSNSLAPIHRMNPLMSSNSQIFPSLNSSIPGLTTANGASSSNAADKSNKTTASKKRKAPASSTASVNDDSDDDKDPQEYEDPKAKRRAQIAKAARKHRQRQKVSFVCYIILTI